MRQSNVFAKEQVSATQQYMLGSLLEYYAGKSIQQHGLWQFLQSFPQILAMRPWFALKLYWQTVRNKMYQHVNRKIAVL